MASYTIRSIRDLDIQGKKLFLRLDLNVPLSRGADASKTVTVSDDNRIQEALPTIRYAMEKGAKVILASHLGRPDGKRNPAYSLEPVASRLAELLGPGAGSEVNLADDCVGDGIELMAQGLRPGQILLLENLRFHAGEEANDSKFTNQLIRLTEVFVTDAFGTAHRKHASTYGLPSATAVKGMGFLIEKELKFLDRLLHEPTQPFFAVLGGAKVSDKIKTIDALLQRVKGVAIGGAMAYAFTAAQGQAVPPQAKHPSPADVDAAKAILKDAKKRDVQVLLPSDTIDGFDIGPKTIEAFKAFLAPARTLFWNGPLGWFEKQEYAKGTFAVAEFLATLPAVKVVGGGETVAAVKQSGASSRFDHLSTGGGAVLEYLEGNGLPGIDILRTADVRGS